MCMGGCSLDGPLAGWGRAGRRYARLRTSPGVARVLVDIPIWTWGPRSVRYVLLLEELPDAGGSTFLRHTWSPPRPSRPRDKSTVAVEHGEVHSTCIVAHPDLDGVAQSAQYAPRAVHDALRSSLVPRCIDGDGLLSSSACSRRARATFCQVVLVGSSASPVSRCEPLDFLAPSASNPPAQRPQNHLRPVLDDVVTSSLPSGCFGDEHEAAAAREVASSMGGVLGQRKAPSRPSRAPSLAGARRGGSPAPRVQRRCGGARRRRRRSSRGTCRRCA